MNNKLQWLIQTKTLSSNIEFSAEAICVKTIDIIKYIDRQKYSDLCKNGCINYGHKWSCPPFAPSYLQYADEYKYLWIFVFFANLEQFSYIKNDYLKVKAANTILKSRIDKVLRNLSQIFGRYISTGSCRLCKPCKCKSGMLCAKPDKMSYSFEALGVDVGAMTREVLNHDLLWYKKCHLPEYTTVVTGLLSSEKIDTQIIEAEIKKF